MLPFGERLFPIGSAPEAGARRALGGNFDECPTSFFRFVGQDRQELCPPGIVDTLGKSRRSVGDHLLRIQVLDADQAIFGNNPVCKFMVKIKALIRRFRMKTAQALLYLVVISGTLLFAGKPSLCLGNPFFRLPIPTRIVDFFPRRERSEGVNAYIDPDFAVRDRMKDLGDLDAVRGEGHIPLP